MLDNQNFYPTPEKLISKMLSKVVNKRNIRAILEPSAGMGHIVDYLYKSDSFNYRKSNIFLIENDPNLQAHLRAKNFDTRNEKKGFSYNLIDSDFLHYNGIESFDLIIANFPFSDGEKHLLKAIDLMFSGQIVCLINAETLKNPYSNRRKQLIQKLEETNATVEYLEGEFEFAERKTNVEVALVYINIEATVEKDIFNNIQDEKEEEINFKEDYSLENTESIKSLVCRYELEKERVREFILNFYNSSALVSDYLKLKVTGVGELEDGTLTDTIKYQLNQFSKNIKKKYWNKAIELDVIKDKLTTEKRKEFRELLKQNDKIEFNENNLYQLLENLIKDLPEMMSDSVISLFKSFTNYALHDSHYGKEFKKNVHFFSGWKTNHGYKVQKKVIMPFYQDMRWSNTMDVSYDQVDFLDNIDKVLKYFKRSDWTRDMSDICKESLKEGKSKKIDTGFFYVSFYKKGTIHLEFKDEDVLRLFNIEAGRKLKFLPDDYGLKKYDDLDEESRVIIDQFEGKKNYKTVKNNRLEITRESLKLTFIGQDNDNK